MRSVAGLERLPAARTSPGAAGPMLPTTLEGMTNGIDPRGNRKHAARSATTLRTAERRRALAEARVLQPDRLDEGPHGPRDDRGGGAGRFALPRRHRRRVHGRKHWPLA